MSEANRDGAIGPGHRPGVVWGISGTPTLYRDSRAPGRYALDFSGPQGASPMKSAVLIVLACAALGGCAAGKPSSNAGSTVAAASDAQRAALIERVKTLQGIWESDVGGHKGQSVFAVSSAGSAVREIMDQGGPHEMTNMYHMDGPTLVMTHYCAAGNQPRMRARAGGDAGAIRFESDGVSNLLPSHQGYMGSMTLVFINEDTVRQDWVYIADGKPGEPFSIVLRRKR
jgi:hypothetical protein